MKAITVPQPNAQLIALGVQTIWTSKRSTKYRGPLVIHAGMAVPRLEDRGGNSPATVVGPYGVFRSATGQLWAEHYGVGVGVLPPHLEGFELPLGAIVASCNLVDVVPIVGQDDDMPESACIEVSPTISLLWGSVTIVGKEDVYGPREEDTRLVIAEVTGQLPYGDFTPGNYAWLLEDVQPVEKRCPACWEPCEHNHPHRSECVYCPDCPVCHGRLVCEPIPTKGKQGLWTVTW